MSNYPGRFPQARITTPFGPADLYAFSADTVRVELSEAVINNVAYSGSVSFRDYGDGEGFRIYAGDDGRGSAAYHGVHVRRHNWLHGGYNFDQSGLSASALKKLLAQLPIDVRAYLLAYPEMLTDAAAIARSDKLASLQAQRSGKLRELAEIDAQIADVEGAT